MLEPRACSVVRSWHHLRISQIKYRHRHLPPWTYHRSDLRSSHAVKCTTMTLSTSSRRSPPQHSSISNTSSLQHPLSLAKANQPLAEINFPVEGIEKQNIKKPRIRDRIENTSSSMLRYQIFLCWGALWAAIWYQAMNSEETVVEISPLSPETTKILIQFLPLWILVSLAIYAIATILYGLATLRDFPEASAELEKEVKEAKTAMKKRGVPIVE